jgi:PAS domain S-box-containing protein
MPPKPSQQSDETLRQAPAYREVVGALAESEERYRMLVEGVRHYAIYMIDAHGTIQTWNKGFQALLGYSREETIGHRGTLCFTNDDRAEGAYERELAEAARSGESSVDRFARRRDGSQIAVNDIVTALYNASGGLIGFGKVTRELPVESADEAKGRRLSEAEEQIARTLALLHVEMEHRRELESRLLTAVEAERQRLGQDLHDDLSQHLGGTALIAGNLANRIAKKLPEEQEAARQVAELIREANTIARNVARGLHPVTLASEGLVAALGELAERVPIEVDYKPPTAERLDIDLAIALHIYRISEEAVGNAVRHSGATKIHIELTLASPGMLNVAVADNGKGLEKSEATDGMGIRNMKYRAGVVGGSLRIESSPGNGTRVECAVPLPKARVP